MEHLDHATCYEAITRRDARFDGRFYTGVTTTGIFCRPSCPARTPKSGNVRFFPHAATAAEAGFRPCRRCRPELAPGHPEWNRRADLAGRALSLIEDGMVDRAGVTGLASTLGVSERHLRRELNAVVGTGPLQLARARRLWLGRLLLDQTKLPIIDVAHAAGFGSLRQFNESIRSTFHATPSELRRRVGSAPPMSTITLSLPCRGPVGWPRLHRFLAARAIPGLESSTATTFTRNVAGGWIELSADPDSAATLRLRCPPGSLAELAELLPTVRRVADLDTDLEPIGEELGTDPLLAPRLRAGGLGRLPGPFDRFEVAVRAVVGQQISVAGARTLLGRLVALAGEPTDDDDGEAPRPDRAPEAHTAGSGDDTGDDHVAYRRFPTPEQVAACDLDQLGMPARRRATIRTVAEAVADGRVNLGPHADPDQTRDALVALPGIGPWTAGYVAMRALGDPDGWPVGDLGLRRSLGLDPAELEAHAERWRPWRAYAAGLLWNTDPTQVSHDVEADRQPSPARPHTRTRKESRT